jgi:LAO/AO transport system kinase
MALDGVQGQSPWWDRAAQRTEGLRPTSSAPRPGVADYAAGIIARNRAVLARAITLVESRRPEHAAMAAELIALLMPHTGRAIRVGVTGVPGAGKSALIEALGSWLTARGHRVAVLAVDPSSTRSGGSLLGDKTRMTRLSADPNAFIRPSPSGLVLGGAARTTRETIKLCEAAGYDVVLIETVGVGQSEVAVADMTDFLLVLMLAGAGDELQGLKRGLLERADMIAITKADGDNVAACRRAAAQYGFAMHLLREPGEAEPPVVMCSALEGTGLDRLWQVISGRQAERERTGALADRRARQDTVWMWSLVDQQIRARLAAGDRLGQTAAEIERQVRDGTLSPVRGAESIIGALGLPGCP